MKTELTQLSKHRIHTQNTYHFGRLYGFFFHQLLTKQPVRRHCRIPVPTGRLQVITGTNVQRYCSNYYITRRRRREFFFHVIHQIDYPPAAVASRGPESGFLFDFFYLYSRGFILTIKL